MKRLLGIFTAAALALVAQAATIGTNTIISVRTSEEINVKKNDGQVFSGVVDQNVMDANGKIAVPKGSSAELMVKRLSDNQLVIDLESVTVSGQRYAVTADSASMPSERKDGLGKNKRTGKYVGGGALLGTIIGAVAGGGKGAAIGAAAGAGAGAGAQVLTRGKSVKVPAESLLTFRLERPLAMGITDNGVTRQGRHYHPSKR